MTFSKLPLPPGERCGGAFPNSDMQDPFVANRAAKLERLRERGIDPYPPRFFRSCDNATAAATFSAIEAGQTPESAGTGLLLAGRIVALRNMGRSAFLDLQDESGSIQVLCRRNNLGDDFELLRDLDLGDHLGVEGNLIRTRTGEITIDATSASIIAKGMRPLPEKYHGLRDTETRYRQRYLDLIANREVMDVFRLRSRVISGMRRFLDEQVAQARDTGYVETLLGRRRYIPELRARAWNVRQFGERVAQNTPIQGTAADLIKVAMIRVGEALGDDSGARMLLQVHDELVFEVEDGRVAEVTATVVEEMESALTLDVPLRVDAGSGRTWYDCKI